MKYKKSLLIISVVAALCSACAKNGGIDNANNTDYGTSSSLVSTKDQHNESTDGNKADAWISLIEPDERSYYYAAEHELEIGEDEHIYDGEWCLAENGIYYATSVFYEDYMESHLRFISYEDIEVLENTDNMILGSLERGDKLTGLSEEITLNLKGYGEVNPGYVSAYNDGVALMAYIRESENKKNLMVYLDGKNNVVKIVDVTEQEETVQKLMQEDIEWAGTTKVQVFDRENGNLICSSYEERKKSILCFYTEDSREVKKIAADYSIGNVIYDGIDSLYWIHRGGDDGQKLVRCDINTGETQEGSFDGMKESAYIYVSADKSVLWSQKGIYQFDISAGTLTRVMNWNEAGVKNGLYDRMRIIKDGSIYGAKLVSGAISLCRLQKSEVAINDDKTVLKLAVSKHSSSDFETLVRDFNASNSMYNVELVEYDDSYAFTTSLTSKDGVDMISTDIIDMEQFAEKGYTVDLYEFLNRTDSAVKKDDIIESIRNVYTFDGKLAALPVTFYPLVLFGGDEFDSESWNIDEFIALIEKNDRAVTNYMYNIIDCRSDLVLIYWNGMKDKLIDWKNMEAHFDNADFVRFLNALKNYRPPMPTDDYSVSQYVYWKEGQIYLYRQQLQSPSWLQYTRAVMENDNPVILGYPTEKGSAFPIGSSNSMAISAKSRNKDGAWIFMQYVLKNSDVIIGSEFSMSGYPVYIPLLNELLDELSVKTYKRDDNYEIVTDKDGNPVEKSMWGYSSDGEGGMNVPIYAMTDKDREDLWYIFNNMGMISGYSTPAYEIFEEEIEAFLDGIQTAEQTAKILQDRMTLMLEE